MPAWLSQPRSDAFRTRPAPANRRHRRLCHVLHRIRRGRAPGAGAWLAVGLSLLEVADGAAGPLVPGAGGVPAALLARNLGWRRRGFSVAQHGADVLAFIDQVAGQPAHLVGHSRGGRVALEAALARPDALRSLTLADPGLPLPGDNDLRGGFRQRALELIRDGALEEGLALFVDTVTGPDTWQRMVPWFKEMVRDNAGTLFGQARETPATLSPEQIGSLALPTLLIGGALSPRPTRRYSTRWRSGCPRRGASTSPARRTA
ncbi:alpha/beta hydrolase [Achromobacter xylosoxidans]